MEHSWRTGIHEWLNAIFPCTEPHREVNCCVGAAGSLTGVFHARVNFTGQKPDLVFIEYSLVDFCKPVPRALTERSVEVLVRTIKSINPDCEICFLYYFCFRTDDHLNGRYTPVEKIYETIADHYGIPSISVAQFVVELSHSGAMHLTGDNDRPAIYRRDLHHLTMEGNRRVVEFLCEQLEKLLATKAARPSAKLIGSLRPVRIEDWRSYKVREDMLSGNSEIVRIPEGKRGLLRSMKLREYVALYPGGKLTFKIRGHLAAISIVIGPNSGVTRFQVGDNIETRNLFDTWCFAERIAMYEPFPYPDIQERARTREIVVELMGSVPKGIREPRPVQKPSKWTLGIVDLRVIGKLL
jgi:hypothetical protein